MHGQVTNDDVGCGVGLSVHRAVKRGNHTEPVEGCTFVMRGSDENHIPIFIMPMQLPHVRELLLQAFSAS